MKKFGLTLSELVVAVSVIGIAASLIVPVVSKLVPDTRKSTVLKYNALINNVIAEFYNSNYYAPQATLQEEGGEATTSDCTGISCFSADTAIANFEGFIEDRLELDSNKIAPDGVKVTVAKLENESSYSIELDTDTKNTSSYTYSVNNTDFSQVDTFNFKIDNNGTVSPDDALSAAYFANQYGVGNKVDDMKKAAKLLSKYKK